MDASALARVEQQRIELEANIAKLRKSLRHWQTLEIDYEGLKEEFLGIPDDSSAEECLQAAKDFKPELIDEKELQELLVDTKSNPRRPAQLVDLLSKRVDYVSRNIETVRKQLSDAERKRNVLLLAEEPDHQEQAGLPLAEITEELDDSGQVISSRVQTPGSSAPQLLDVLKKAGIDDLEEEDGKITTVDLTDRAGPGANLSTALSQQGVHPEGRPEDELSNRPSSDAEGVIEEILTNPNDTEAEARLRREMWDYSRGIDEVGAIVAELDLEEDASDISYDEQDDALELDSDFDDDDGFDEAESEDETGKSTHRLTVPRGYRKRMEELQEKLGLKNVGPSATTELVAETVKQEQRPPAAEAARQAAIAREEKSKKSSLKSAVKASTSGEKHARQGKSGKKVAFSSELDIAPEEPMGKTTGVVTKVSQKSSPLPQARPINDSVVEREVASIEEDAVAPAPTPLIPAGKPSRFKAARQSQPQTPMFAPSMNFPTKSSRQDQGRSASPTPLSKLVSPTLVERPSSSVPEAPDPVDFPEEAHRREIALEYQRHRMKRIQSQERGFLGNGEEDNYGEMITPGSGRDDDDGNERKISRFKAARINR